MWVKTDVASLLTADFSNTMGLANRQGKMAGTEMAAVLTCLCVVLMGCVVVGVSGQEGDWGVVMDRIHESAMSGSSHQSPTYLLRLLQPDGSFSDLPYGKDSSGAFGTHGRRQGALAYHHLNGENLAQEILSCFSYITYDAPGNIDLNWWGHLIGTPSKMWESAVLARDILPKDLLLDFLDRYWVNTPFGAVWNPDDHTGANSGGNLGPRAMLAEVEGLLRGTHATIHAEVSQELYRELAQRQPWLDNGLRPDGCLHQHNIKGDHRTEHAYLNHTLWTIYNGSYGKELLKFTSLLLTWYTGTSHDYEDATIEGLFAAYLECQKWLFRGHTMEPTTTGRFIASGDLVTKYGTRSGVRDTGYQLQKLGRHLPEVEAVLHRYDNVVPDPKYALVGNMYFFNSNLVVHQRRNYMASLRVFSNRTARQETWISGLNNKGFFQADGFLTLLMDSKEYGSPGQEVFVVYDWAKVPGVTNLYTNDVPKFHSSTYWSERFFNNASFVGGVTDGTIGVAAMLFSRPHVALTYLKTWFFFDDVIVPLGSDITLPTEDTTGESVITTLTQVSYRGSYVVGTEDGGEVSLDHLASHQEERPAWLHHGNVGYVFLNGDEYLYTSAESRTHKSGSMDVFTAWLDHGATPKDASVAYAVLPAADLARTRAFAADPDVEVISQTNDLHVVCHHPSKTVGAALVASGGSAVARVEKCGGAGPLEVRADVSCLLLVTITSNTADAAHVTLTLADPQQLYDTITVQLAVDGRQVEKTVQLPLPPRRGASVITTLVV